MIKSVRLKHFKNFKDATLLIGPLTILIGANAAGKSNIRDAFRFLHGIGRGYSLAEIIGEKYGEGGVLQWSGIRGGIKEIATKGFSSFSIEASFSINIGSSTHNILYSIDIEISTKDQTPRIFAESLYADEKYIFKSIQIEDNDNAYIDVNIRRSERGRRPSIRLLRNQPILSQYTNDVVRSEDRRMIRATLSALSDIRFLDLSPDAMKNASFPGQVVLGDRGENLSSVLQAITTDAQRRDIFTQWLQELTPMDAADFAFPADQIGRILVTLIEKDGTSISAYSASDGTLRFLGILAALLGPDPASFYFFEELDTGIHPARLHILIGLIEQQVRKQPLQIMASTHSPQLLRIVSQETLEKVSLVYRLKARPEANIKQILQMPEITQILAEQDVASLHDTGWFEDAVTLMEHEETL